MNQYFTGNVSKNSGTLHILFEFMVLGIIIILALIIRIYPVIKFPETVKMGFGQFGDTHLYHKIAYNLYQGKGFSGAHDGRAYGFEQEKTIEYGPAIVRGPVYPVFLCAIYSLPGNRDNMKSVHTWRKNLDMVRLVQCVMDALLCLLLFFICRMVVPESKWPAFLAAILYCFSFYNIYYTETLLSESLTTFLITLFLFFSIAAEKYDKFKGWFMAGGLLGIIILTRPEYILLPIAMALSIISFNREAGLKHNLKKAFMIISVSIMVIAPWTIRNYIVTNRFIPVSSSGVGATLYAGTYEKGDEWRGWGNYPDEIFKNTEEKNRIMALSKAYGYHVKEGGLGIIDVDREFFKSATDRIRKNPLNCIKIWIFRIPRLWYQNYIQIYKYKKEPSGLLFIFYFVFAVSAFCLIEKEKRKLIMPVAILFFYLSCIFLPLHVEPRYGVPAMPGIICATAIGMWSIGRLFSLLIVKSKQPFLDKH